MEEFDGGTENLHDLTRKVAAREVFDCGGSEEDMVGTIGARKILHTARRGTHCTKFDAVRSRNAGGALFPTYSQEYSVRLVLRNNYKSWQEWGTCTVSASRSIWWCANLGPAYSALESSLVAHKGPVSYQDFLPQERTVVVPSPDAVQGEVYSYMAYASPY